jgi:hypothetical protein
MLMTSFLGNHKAVNYHEIVCDLLKAYKAIGCNMPLKVHHLDFPENLGTVSDEHEERDFIGTFTTWKSCTRASGASVCWMTTAGPSREMFHR